MPRVNRRSLARWLIVPLFVALLSSYMPFESAAFSYDAKKIDPALLAAALANPQGDFPVIVRSVPGAARVDRAGKSLQKNQGKAKHQLGIVGGASGTITGIHLFNLSRDPDVDYVFLDATMRALFDPVLDAPKVTIPGILEIGAPTVWSQLGVTGRGVGVAVVDSGVYAHPDLAGRIRAAIDFTSATPTVSATPLGDPGGHGTHVAGLIAGDGTSSNATYTGVAPGAHIVDVRVIDANGNTNTSTVLRGLQWVLNNRVTYAIRVVNMSLGRAPTTSYKVDVLATAAEVLNFAGITVVVSAGNSGSLASTITSPATDPYVLSVGAVDDAGTAVLTDDAIATWSSRGATAYDGIAKPDVVAPGRKMVSLRSPGSTLDTLYPTRQVTATGATTASYFLLSGTSMAAPVAAGTAALMLERDPALTPKKIKKRLQKAATPLVGAAAYDQGAGMINAFAAVSSLEPGNEYTPSRVTDAFAKDMLKFVSGQPIVWRNLTYNGGVDSKGIPWANITWANITWENITWENITWEAFTWTNITWENITWENITWELSSTLSLNVLALWVLPD